jgi:hypothetical protein
MMAAQQARGTMMPAPPAMDAMMPIDPMSLPLMCLAGAVVFLREELFA